MWKLTLTEQACWPLHNDCAVSNRGLDWHVYVLFCLCRLLKLHHGFFFRLGFVANCRGKSEILWNSWLSSALRQDPFPSPRFLSWLTWGTPISALPQNSTESIWPCDEVFTILVKHDPGAHRNGLMTGTIEYSLLCVCARVRTCVCLSVHFTFPISFYGCNDGWISSPEINVDIDITLSDRHHFWMAFVKFLLALSVLKQSGSCSCFCSGARSPHCVISCSEKRYEVLLSFSPPLTIAVMVEFLHLNLMWILTLHWAISLAFVLRMKF